MSKKNKSLAKKRNDTRHDFLLTFFPEAGRYSVVEVNNFVLTQQWNAGSGRWEVAVFRKESYMKVKAWKQNQLI